MKTQDKRNAPYWGLVGEQLNLAIACLAGLGFLLFGYDQGVMGGLLTLPSFVATFPAMDTISPDVINDPRKSSHNSTVQGAAVALYEIGCMFGALSCLYVGDKFGRRKVIFAGGIIMIIGAILQSTSFTLAHFIVARMVTGYGNGYITATVPTWQSECSKAHKRGKLVMIEGALITGGIAISYWIDFGFFFLGDSEASWRAPIALQIVFAALIVATVLNLPESPRWLLKKGYVDEATAVFAALNDTSVDDPEVQQSVAEVQVSLVLTGQSGLKDLFTMGKSRNFHRAALGYLNQMFQQITGINLITYYATTIYENYLGLSPTLSRILAAANGTEYFLASWIAVYTIERFGRRKLMLFGAVGQACTMAILAALAWDAQVHNNKAAAVSAAVFLFVFNSFFAVGWLGMTWLYPAEIVPLEIRAPSNGISTASNWLWNFCIVMITPVSFTNIRWKTYIVFAAINAFMVPATYLLFPETAYRSLEEIDVIFAKSPGWKGWFTVVRNADPAVTPLQHPPRSYDTSMVGCEEDGDAGEQRDHPEKLLQNETSR